MSSRRLTRYRRHLEMFAVQQVEALCQVFSPMPSLTRILSVHPLNIHCNTIVQLRQSFQMMHSSYDQNSMGSSLRLLS